MSIRSAWRRGGGVDNLARKVRGVGRYDLSDPVRRRLPAYCQDWQYVMSQVPENPSSRLARTARVGLLAQRNGAEQVRQRPSEPSLFMIQISAPPSSRSRMYAMRRPSGDQWG